MPPLHLKDYFEYTLDEFLSFELPIRDILRERAFGHYQELAFKFLKKNPRLFWIIVIVDGEQLGVLTKGTESDVPSFEKIQETIEAKKKLILYFDVIQIMVKAHRQHMN